MAFVAGGKSYAMPSLISIPWHFTKMLEWGMSGLVLGPKWAGLHSLRVLNDWEVEKMERLFQTLQNKKISPNNEDKLLSKESKDEHFAVKFMHKMLDHSSSIAFSSRVL